MKVKKIQIPVPWGFIKGNFQGNEKNSLVIAVHGELDNCNSFYNLIPLLPKSFSYFWFDLPSHGKSSHFVTKSLPSIFDFILAIKLVLDYFNKTKYILMGYSMGGQLLTMYTQMYPEQVEKLIVIDTIYFLPVEPEDFLIILNDLFERYIKAKDYNQDSTPVYSFEQAVNKLKDIGIVDFSDELIIKILERILIQIDHDKYQFSFAQHVKYKTPIFFSKEYIINLIKAFPIQCPHLLIRASESNELYKYMKDILQTLISTNKMFQMNSLEGYHNIHNTKSEEVANIIHLFLLNNKL